MDSIEEPLFFILNAADQERFMARTTVQSTGCLLIDGVKDKDGYARFWVNEISKGLRAHRVAYLHRHGSIPVGMVIDHLCRERSCVNPDHLDAVPQVVNYARGNRPRSSPLFVAKSHCKRGHPRSGDNLGGPTPSGQFYCKACLAERNAVNNAKRATRRAETRKGN